jgi:O-antigen/teichoic acid export membrane protein
MDYVGLSVNTATVLAGSILSGIAVWLGWGLPGLAAATMLNVMLISIGRFWIARRAIPWLAVKKPTREGFVRFAQTCTWLFVSGLAAMFLYSSDTLLVGFALGPASAATYFTSGNVLRMIGEPLYQIVMSGSAGLIGLCGEQAWDRVATARKEMYFLMLFFMTILGTGVIALNGVFLKLWLGDNFFGGKLLTLLLVLSVLFTFLTRIDYTISDAMLFLREKTWFLFVSGLVAIIIGFAALKLFGPVGMALGMTLGNLILLITAWLLIQRRIPNAFTDLGHALLRPAIVMVAMFGAAYLLQPYIITPNWLTFFGIGTAVGLSTLLIAWFLVLSNPIRQMLFKRARQNIPFLNNISFL